ncbi:MAG TPA: ATP-binding protein, partial [Smithellaceae bacterium]|nr:ATP-binding protein [Smithellaceae bacterium]
FLLSLDPVDATYETLITELQHSGNAIIVPHGLQFSLESLMETPERQTGRLVFYNVLKIYKEMLTNIVKHAGAKSVLVRVALRSGLFTLSVADDGGGMHPGKIKGRGIENMKTRAKDMGGGLLVLSDQGTRVCLEVPVGPADDIKNSGNPAMEVKA